MKFLKYKFVETYFHEDARQIANHEMKLQLFMEWYAKKSIKDELEWAWAKLRWELKKLAHYHEHAHITILKESGGIGIRTYSVLDKREFYVSIEGMKYDTYYSLRVIENSAYIPIKKWQRIERLCELYLEYEKMEKKPGWGGECMEFAWPYGDYDRRRMRFARHDNALADVRLKTGFRRVVRKEVLVLTGCVELRKAHIAPLRCLAILQKDLEPYVKTEICFHGCVPTSKGYVLSDFSRKIWDDPIFTAAIHRGQSWFYHTIVLGLFTAEVISGLWRIIYGFSLIVVKGLWSILKHKVTS